MPLDFAQAQAARKNPGNWVVASNNGSNVVATNSVTGESFSGTTAAYNAIFTGSDTSVGASEMPIIKTGIPVIVPNNITVAVTTGAITLSTLPAIYEHAWIYLPADAVVGGAAGLYYTKFTTTSAGVVYTNYVDPAANTFVPFIPTGTLTVANGSNSAITSTTGEVTLINATIPAGAMGVNGTLEATITASNNNSAGTKAVTLKFGGTAVVATATTTATMASVQGTVQNRGVAGRQSFMTGDPATAIAPQAINTAAAVPLLITANKNTAAVDFIVVEYVRIEVA